MSSGHAPADVLTCQEQAPTHWVPAAQSDLYVLIYRDENGSLKDYYSFMAVVPKLFATWPWCTAKFVQVRCGMST